MNNIKDFHRFELKASILFDNRNNIMDYKIHFKNEKQSDIVSIRSLSIKIDKDNTDIYYNLLFNSDYTSMNYNDIKEEITDNEMIIIHIPKNIDLKIDDVVYLRIDFNGLSKVKIKYFNFKFEFYPYPILKIKTYFEILKYENIIKNINYNFKYYIYNKNIFDFYSHCSPFFEIEIPFMTLNLNSNIKDIKNINNTQFLMLFNPYHYNGKNIYFKDKKELQQIVYEEFLNSTELKL